MGKSSTFLRKEDLLALVDSARLSPDISANRLRSYVEQLNTSEFEVGWPMAKSLLDIWKHRCADLPVRDSFMGWPAFFDSLESAEGVVGLVGLRNGGPVDFLLVLSGSGDRILSVLSKRTR